MIKHIRDNKKQRRNRYYFGHTGESIACIWLRLKGYQIIARRFKTHVGEIDIIAQQAGVIVFIEVKARKELNVGLMAVTKTAWLRIARTAEIWMSKSPKYNHHGWRYDLIVIQPFRIPFHSRDHWRP